MLKISAHSHTDQPTVLDNKRPSRHPSKNIGQFLLNSCKQFWRFSLYYGEYISTPPHHR